MPPADSLKPAAAFSTRGGVWLSAQNPLFRRLTRVLSFLFQPSDTPSSRSPLNLPGTRSEMEEKVIGFELMYLVSLFQLPFPPPPLYSICCLIFPIINAAFTPYLKSLQNGTSGRG